MIGHFEGMHNRPQIIITYQTRCKPFLVKPAIGVMAKKMATIPPIDLCITGFNHVNLGHTAKTIYAEIEITPATEKWFKLMILQLGIRIKDYIPHIVITENIPVTAFNKLWPNFANRNFVHPFMVNNITILQKETYVPYCEWTVYKDLFFENKLIPAF